MCRKTFEIYGREPYADEVTAVSPLIAVDAATAPEFDCRRNVQRDARETKLGAVRADVAPGAPDASGAPGGSCC